MATSTVTQIIDAIIAAIPTSTDYVVVDGANGQTEENDMILIGYSFDEDTPQVTVDIETSTGMGRCKEKETMSIDSVIISWSNDEDMKLHRDRVIEMYGIARSALKDDPTLGGACMYNTVTGYSLAQAQFPQGYGCYLEFSVETQAFADFGGA